jgi:hypothetical protein
VAAGEVLMDVELAAVGASLTDPGVRESLLDAVFSGELPDGEALWGLLARVLPDAWRAQALVMVMASALTRGDGQLSEAAVTAVMEDLADAVEFTYSTAR